MSADNLKLSIGGSIASHDKESWGEAQFLVISGEVHIFHQVTVESMKNYDGTYEVFGNCSCGSCFQGIFRADGLVSYLGDKTLAGLVIPLLSRVGFYQ